MSNNKQQQTALEVALLNQLMSKTKSNSQTKINEYKPVLSARGSSSIAGRTSSNSKHKGSKHNSTATTSAGKQGANAVSKGTDKKISVNVLNKNNSHYKSSNTSQKNLLNPIIDEERTHQHKNVVKGIQIKGFGKALGLPSEHKTPDNYSDNSRVSGNKVINVNIKTANTKYLAQTTRNIYRSEV